MPPLRNPNQTFVKSNVKTELEPPQVIRNLLLFFVGFVIFLSACVYGGIYYVKTQNENKIAEVKAIESELSKTPLTQMLDLYYGVNTINTVLAGHDSVKFFLDFIADSVIDQVYYNSFTYKRKDDSNVNIALTGIAESYAAVALQYDSLKREKYKDIVKNVELTGISKNTGKENIKDEVKFSLSIDLRADLDYANTQFVEKDNPTTNAVTADNTSVQSASVAQTESNSSTSSNQIIQN